MVNKKVVKLDWGTVDSGILFIIYINDLDLDIKSSISKFADTKVGRITNSTGDETALQRDLDMLLKWSNNWQMVSCR